MAGMHLIMIWGTYKYMQGTREQRYVLRDDELSLRPNDPKPCAIEHRRITRSGGTQLTIGD